MFDYIIIGAVLVALGILICSNFILKKENKKLREKNTKLLEAPKPKAEEKPQTDTGSDIMKYFALDPLNLEQLSICKRRAEANSTKMTGEESDRINNNLGFLIALAYIQDMNDGGSLEKVLASKILKFPVPNKDILGFNREEVIEKHMRYLDEDLNKFETYGEVAAMTEKILIRYPYKDDISRCKRKIEQKVQTLSQRDLDLLTTRLEREKDPKNFPLILEGIKEGFAIMKRELLNPVDKKNLKDLFEATVDDKITLLQVPSKAIANAFATLVEMKEEFYSPEQPAQEEILGEQSATEVKDEQLISNLESSEEQLKEAKEEDNVTRIEVMDEPGEENEVDRSNIQISESATNIQDYLKREGKDTPQQDNRKEKNKHKRRQNEAAVSIP